MPQRLSKETGFKTLHLRMSIRVIHSRLMTILPGAKAVISSEPLTRRATSVPVLERPKQRRNMLPEVYFRHTTEFCQRVLRRCELLECHYSKPSFLWNSHVETIWAAGFRKKLDLPLQRSFLETPDGGLLTLDTLKTVLLDSSAVLTNFVGFNTS